MISFYVLLLLFPLFFQWSHCSSLIEQYPITCSSLHGPYCPEINGLTPPKKYEKQKNTLKSVLEQVEDTIKSMFGTSFTQAGKEGETVQTKTVVLTEEQIEALHGSSSKEIDELLENLGVDQEQVRNAMEEAVKKIKELKKSNGESNEKLDKQITETSNHPHKKALPTSKNEIIESSSSIKSNPNNNLEYDNIVNSVYKQFTDFNAEEMDAMITKLLETHSEDEIKEMYDSMENIINEYGLDPKVKSQMKKQLQELFRKTPSKTTLESSNIISKDVDEETINQMNEKLEGLLKQEEQKLQENTKKLNLQIQKKVAETLEDDKEDQNAI